MISVFDPLHSFLFATTLGLFACFFVGKIKKLRYNATFRSQKGEGKGEIRLI